MHIGCNRMYIEGCTRVNTLYNNKDISSEGEISLS